MMKTRIGSLAYTLTGMLLGGSYSSLSAQQLLDNTFYVVNPYGYNASQAGNHIGMRATVQFSGQSTGLPSSARTTQLMLDGPINRTTGLGARIFYQQWGTFKNTTISGDTSYKAELSTLRDHYFRFGVGLASQWQNIDYSALNQNGYTNMADPVFTAETFSRMDILVGGGVLYHHNDFEASLSVPYVFSFYKQRRGEFLRNLLLAVGYNFSLQNDLIRIDPTVLINPYAGNIFLAEGIVLADYRRLFWVQTGYRLHSELIASAGFNMKRLKVGYSLTFPFGQYAKLAGVEHAVVLFFTGDKALLKRLQRHTTFIEKHIGSKHHNEEKSQEEPEESQDR